MRASRLSCSLPATRRGLLALTALAMMGVSAARAQAPAAKNAAPPPPDTRPMARYIPRENLAVYAGTDGLETVTEAWNRTAAYKILTETSVGSMLEEMLTQLADQRMADNPNRKMNGADLVTIVKHVARYGFALGLEAKEGSGFGVLAFRGASSRDVRAPFARWLGTMMGDAKPQVIKKAGRTMIAVPGPDGKTPQWFWWSEGNDLVIADSGGEEIVADVIDGKRPSALDHPLRTELSRPEGGFTPIAMAFLDSEGKIKVWENRAGMFFGRLAELGIHQFDYRVGFQDDALMTVARLKAPNPRKGLLAALDQPSFDKTKLLPIPQGLEDFTAFSIDGAKLIDQLMESASPEAKTQLSNTLDTFKTKSRVDLRKDVLSLLGPNMIAYIMPGTGATPARAAGSEPPPDEKNAPNFASRLLGGLNLGGGLPMNPLSMIRGPIPRWTLVADVKDDVAFGKALDNLMIAVNRELRERAAEAAEHAPRPGNAPAPGAEAGDEGSDGGRARKTAPPSPEFKLMPGGKDKVYALNIPSAISRRFPAGFRPTIRLSGKHLFVAVAPDVARQAEEVKADEWSPSGDLAPAYDQLPKNLTVLRVSDPRSTLPALLAAFPGQFQFGLNSAYAAGLARLNPPKPDQNQAGQPGVAPGGNAAYPGSNAAYPGAISSGSALDSASPQPGAIPPAGYPGSGGSGGSGSGGPSTPSDTLVTFRIDPAKMPKADDIRARLFPGSLSVTTDDQMVRIVSRHAFPNMVAASALLGIPMVQSAIQKAKEPPKPAAGNEAGGGAEAPATPGGSSTSPAFPGGSQSESPRNKRGR